MSDPEGKKSESGATADGGKAGETDSSRNKTPSRRELRALLGASGAKIRTVAGSAADARREGEKTRELVRIRRATVDSVKVERCAEAEKSLFLLMLPDLDEAQRAARERAVEGHPDCATEFNRISAHLEMHRGSQQPPRPRDGFLRLKSRLRRDGYLIFAWPGSHCLWRRAFAAGMVVSILVGAMLLWPWRTVADQELAPVPAGTLSTVDSDGSAVGYPRVVPVMESMLVSGGSAYLWIATPERGESISVWLREGTRFRLESTSQLLIEEGEATLAKVPEGATVHAPFVVSTSRAELVTNGGTFTLEANEGLSKLNVWEGVVTLRSRGTNVTRLVRAGYGTEVRAGEPPLAPFQLVELAVESYPQRQLLVSVRNRSMRQLSVSKANGPDAGCYEMMVSQDQSGSQAEPFSEVVRAIPIPGHPANRGYGAGFEEHTTMALLSPEGRGQQSYQFALDFLAALVWTEPADYTVEMTYRGRVIVEGVGQIDMVPMSRSLRLNMRTLREGGER